MLLCSLYLAARRHEIFNLKIDDIDLTRKKIRLYTRKRKDLPGVRLDTYSRTTFASPASSSWRPRGKAVGIPESRNWFTVF
jgi:integrase